jgi:hypothetical protein
MGSGSLQSSRRAKRPSTSAKRPKWHGPENIFRTQRRRLMRASYPNGRAVTSSYGTARTMGDDIVLQYKPHEVVAAFVERNLLAGGLISLAAFGNGGVNN